MSFSASFICLIVGSLRVLSSFCIALFFTRFLSSSITYSLLRSFPHLSCSTSTPSSSPPSDPSFVMRTSLFFGRHSTHHFPRFSICGLAATGALLVSGSKAYRMISNSSVENKAARLTLPPSSRPTIISLIRLATSRFSYLSFIFQYYLKASRLCPRVTIQRIQG